MHEWWQQHTRWWANGCIRLRRTVDKYQFARCFRVSTPPSWWFHINANYIRTQHTKTLIHSLSRSLSFFLYLMLLFPLKHNMVYAVCATEYIDWNGTMNKVSIYTYANLFFWSIFHGEKRLYKPCNNCNILHGNTFQVSIFTLLP